MPRPRLIGFRLLVLSVLASPACQPGEPAPDVVRTPDTVPVAQTETVEPPSSWWDPLGVAIIVPLPDGEPVLAASGNTSERLAGARLQLLGRSGTIDSAIVREVVAPGTESGCANLPHLRLDVPRGTLVGWQVGLIGARVAGIPADSISGLASRDSAAMAAAILAAASRQRTSDQRFEGLPFSVHAAWRVNADGADQFHVAQLIRRVNIEASPLEERSFLVLEPRSRDQRALEVVYAERSGGSEATVEGIDLLAVVRLRGGPVTLLVAREGESGTAFSLVERQRSRSWVLRWTSDRTHCE
jgi:hypothetical protein